MSILEDNEEEQPNNVIPFKRGDRGSITPWLSELEEGTCFLAKNKDQTWGILDQWIVVKHFEKSTLLVTTINAKNTFNYVDDREFSKVFSLQEIIGIEQR